MMMMLMMMMMMMNDDDDDGDDGDDDDDYYYFDDFDDYDDYDDGGGGDDDDEDDLAASHLRKLCVGEMKRGMIWCRAMCCYNTCARTLRGQLTSRHSWQRPSLVFHAEGKNV